MQLEEDKIAEEMKKMEYEPLDSMELKLIRWSLGLGVGLLLVLYWVSSTFFPSAHG